MGLSYEEALKLGPDVAAAHPDAPGNARAPEGRRKVNALGQNKTEARFDAYLADLRHGRRLIVDFWWEPFNLRLGGRCHLRVDFLARRNDDTLAAFDVKGAKAGGFHAEEDAVVKLKAAAERYTCFDFYVAAPRGAGWSFYPVGRRGIGRGDVGENWVGRREAQPR